MGCTNSRQLAGAEQEIPPCLELMTLNGSLATDQGWKVSYHVMYPCMMAHFLLQ